MATRKKYAVLIMLLALLAAAIANFVVVNKAYNNSLEQITPRPDNSTAAPAIPLSYAKMRGSLRGLPYRGQGWRGDVALNKTGDGYEITLRATDLMDATVPVSSFEVDIRRPGADSPGLTPVFSQQGDGRFTALVQFPGAGDWEVHVRMHRGNQTLQFARRFHIK